MGEMMTTTLKDKVFRDWTEENTKIFRKDIMTVRHRLSETGLFTDEALIELLEKHPSEKLDVCTMSNHDPKFPNKMLTGDFRDADGKTLLEAAKAGAVWINVRQGMNVHPEYKAVLDDMYGAIAEITGQPPFNARGGILISSPIAKVPYHCDQTETILWHVRGKKRIYLYPVKEEFLSDEAYHNIITNDLEDDIPFDPEMDKHAFIGDLEEDQMISWPLNAPHRVDNQTFCVSVTTEYSSRESAFKNSVMYTNAFLAKRFGVKSKWASASMPEKVVKSVAGRVLRKAGAMKTENGTDFVAFKIDKSAENFIQPVEPFVRNF